MLNVELQDMPLNRNTVQTGVLERLTLPELIDIWAEDEIYRRLQEVELFSRTIVREARAKILWGEPRHGPMVRKDTKRLDLRSSEANGQCDEFRTGRRRAQRHGAGTTKN